jgi:hypothetical protein
MQYVSIDIGLFHMAYTYANINEDFTIGDIIDVDLVNIKELCKQCKNTNCNFYHDSCICDYMEHFFYTYQSMLDSASVILFEQQPPMGFVSIQELIRHRYRNKAISVSPASMHCHFNIGDLNYEQRKDATDKIAQKWLAGFKNYTFQERRHDISDSLCQLLFYLSSKHREWLIQQERKKITNIILDLEKFRYLGN